MMDMSHKSIIRKMPNDTHHMRRYALRLSAAALLAASNYACEDTLCSFTDICSHGQPPVFDSIAILPPQPYDRDTLRVSYNVHDPEGQPVTTRIYWYQNGRTVPALDNQSAVLPDYTIPNDKWFAEIIATDDWWTKAKRTSPVTIRPNP